jgi:chloride channel 7
MGMESLDYEVVESLAYREDQAQRGMWRHVSYITLKWTFALLIGVGMPFIALLLICIMW